MPLKLGSMKRPFQTVWSMVGRTLIMDARDRQVITPAADIGGHDWYNDREDWEEMAPVLAASPDLHDSVEALLPKIAGDEMRIVDGRLVFDPSDFDELVGVMEKIKAARPKRKDDLGIVMQDDGGEEGEIDGDPETPRYRR